MESLSGIGSSLPPSVPDAELAHAFRGAALSLTALFKAGKNSTRKAYLAGKREALQDVLEFIQASLDHPPSAPFAGQPAVGPLNVARLIDYLCARQETLKAEEEGDDDEGETVRPSRAAPAPAARPTTFAPSQSTSGHSSAPQRPTTHSTTPAPAHGCAGHRSHDESHPASTSPVASSSSSASSPSAHPSFHPHPPTHRLAHSLPYSSSSASSLASTSSYSFAPTPLSSPLATTASGVSTIALASGAGVPSPLTRLQARMEREHKDKDHRRGGRTGAGSSANAATAGADSLAAGALKRRWGAVAMTEVELDDDDGDESDSAGSPERGDEEREDNSGAGGGPREDAMELEVMEMDGWDGLGERPSKRVARRV